jgi:hypothetical protein
MGFQLSLKAINSIHNKIFYYAACWWLMLVILSYSGSRDQEDLSLKPTQENSSARPYLEKPFLKRTGGVAQGVGQVQAPVPHIKNKFINYVTIKIFFLIL